MGYQGWALFMDCDMLCRADIKELWDQRDDTYGAMCVQHEHVPGETVKFLGEVQSAYPKKNWSSLMLLNCSRCTKLTPDYVNTATGLELHRFHWLEGDHEIGAIKGGWNHLVDVQAPPEDSHQMYRQPESEKYYQKKLISVFPEYLIFYFLDTK